MNQKASLGSDKGKELLTEQELQKLFEIIKTIKYGSVTLVIQDGKVVQIDRNEKVRLK